MRTKIYLAGPMSGIELHNYFEFKRAEQRLEGMGFDVVNPHKIGIEDYLRKNSGQEITKFLIDKYYTTEFMVILAEWQKWDYFMKIDIAELVKCEMVVVLSGWETSRGAMLELTIAHFLKMKMFKESNMKELGYGFNIQKIPVDYLL